MKKNNGYVALSMAILVGVAVMGAVIYLASQGSMKSKQFVGEIQKDQLEGILKLHITQTAALFRAELYKGVNPAAPTVANADFEKSLVDFKCLANPDVKNRAHRYIEPNPPAGKTIVYTCKELPPRTKGAVLTAYFMEKNTVNQDVSATAHVSYELPIGKIITSKGNYIKRTNKLIPEIDSLSPVSFDNTVNPDLNNVYLHDLIQTTNSANIDDKQFLKIFLNDKTVLQIGPDSEFYFKKFLFHKVNERSTLFKLIKGTLQVLYADKNNNEEMLIQTPSIALGVRGTEYKLQVRETNLAYHVTMDVFSGKVAVFENGNKLVKTLLPGQTFNHYQAKNQTTGGNVDGSVRIFEKNNFYNVLPIPTSVKPVTPSLSTAFNIENEVILEKIFKINELILIRRENLLLYGYFHNASRDPSKIYFQHIKTAGGWGNYYKSIRTSLIDEPLFISNKSQYGGMSFPIGQSPVPKSFEIAMMTPNGFATTYDINLNFALVYDQKFSNNSFLLIYPAESLDSLANRFLPGPYTDIQNHIIMSPLPGIKLKDGDIVGCGSGSSPCNDIGSLRAQIPSDYEVSRLIIFNGTKRTITPWPPVPTPVPTVAPNPVDDKVDSKDKDSSSKKSSKKTTPTTPPQVCRPLHLKKCTGGKAFECFEPECKSCKGLSHEESNVVIGTVCE